MLLSIKKSVLTLMIVTVFCLLVFAIMRSLLAGLSFATAEKLAKEYKWTQADEKFRKAIALDPFNARYIAGFGDFMTTQAGYQGHGEPLLKEAEQLYRRAIQLDSRNAKYWFELGLIELNRKAYSKAFENFYHSTDNDPNGFNIAYSIGSVGFSVWKHISDADRAFVMNRLKMAMIAKSFEYIYANVWNAQKDIALIRAVTPDSLQGQRWLYGFIVSQNLWQFRKEQADRLGYYLKNEAPDTFLAEEKAKVKRLKEVRDRYNKQTEKGVVSGSDWHGNTPDGKFTYDKGNMYWTGTMDGSIDMPEGNVTIKIRAKGQPADGVFPYMIVELDGEEIGESFVDSSEWKDYEFKVNTTGGVKVLSVTFANDGGNAKEDRNLFIGTAEILKSGK